LGGKTYYLFTNTDGVNKDTSYYRKSGNAYYEYIAASTYKDSSSGVVIASQAYEYSFLIDNLAANAVFTNGPFTATATANGVPVSITTYLNSTILATGASVTIGTLSYTNVIKVKTIFSYKAGGATTDYYGAEKWFAKGVGLIKYIDYATAPFTTPNYTLNITRSKVY
jgi:hypothetical protein